MLRLAAKRPLAALAYGIPGVLPLGVRLSSPFLARDWKTWYAMFEKDLSRTTLQSFHYSIASLLETDLRARLEEIRVPVMAIYGRKDRIVDPDQGELLADNVPLAQVSYFQKSGHFPMLDETERFHRTLRDFLDR
jgi:pimeloyl-ACP methyl ester carboxylesterase